jgi:hypothetical protein
MPYSLWISAFLGFKESFQIRSRSLEEAESKRKITRYNMARLIGFAWNKAASMGVNISAV